MSEPLTDERLKELRYIVTDTQQWYGALDLPTRGQAMNVADALLKIAPELLAELDRLRALDLDATHAAVDETMLAKYQAWYEASRPIVEAVAFASVQPSAAYRGDIHIKIEILDTIQDQARALLAKEGGVSGEPAIDFHHE
jgi:hypothetical protein